MQQHRLSSTLRRLPSIFLFGALLMALIPPASALAQSAPTVQARSIFLPLVTGGQATEQSVLAAAANELFFSEYVEGSSNNKALEIYNGTGAAIELGLNGYNVQMYFNGSATAGLTINLTGAVANGDVYVVAQSSANTTILAQADQTNGAGWFNGDDAVVLRKGTTIIDVIGQIGTDPGTEWGTELPSTADNTLSRKSTICAGDTSGADAFTPAIEWDGSATDTVAGLGAHTASCNSLLPTLSINDVTLNEGDSGTTVFSFVVSLSAPAGADSVIFDISTSDGTAQDDNPTTEDNDYVAQALTVKPLPRVARKRPST